MKFFFDTSVLVAASEASHSHFAKARPGPERVLAGADEGDPGMHSVAKTYAAIAGLSIQPKILPHEAQEVISQNILKHFTIIPLIVDDYVASISVLATLEIPGAKI